MAQARLTTVTLPDGLVATRRSKTKVYEWVVVVRTDLHARAQRLLREADDAARRWDEVAEIVVSGELSRLGRKVTGVNGRGERSYSSLLPSCVAGGVEHHWLPDWRDADSWARYASNALWAMSVAAQRLRDEAAELAAGPQFDYGVMQWSQRRDSADKAAVTAQSQFLKYRRAGCDEVTVTVEPCQQG